MRLIITVFISMCLTMALQGQTLLFSENFETNSLPDSVTHVGNGTWGKSSTLYSQGTRSDSLRIVNPGDTVAATTYSFSTVGNSFVMLYFDHICKVEFFDAAEIFVSANNGVSWTKLTDAQYQGTGGFSAATGNKFTSTTYTDWLPGNPSTPANTWWKSEVFDISLLVGNAPNVLVRFQLRDMNFGTQFDNYAWFIDNIRLIGAFSELNPPVITMIPPIQQDTLYSTTPYLIKATITDASLVDTAYVAYTVNTGIIDTIGMVLTAPDTYEASIPFYGFGRTIHYKVIAIDGSAAHNVAYNPTTGTRMIYAKYSPGGTYEIGTGTVQSYMYGPLYRSSSTSSYHYSKYSYLLTDAELAAAGVPPGGSITRLEWYKNNAFQTNGNAMFKIYLKNSSQQALTTGTAWTSVIAGATEVYSSTTEQIPITMGWIPFDIMPFTYTGGGIEVSTDWNISMVSSPWSTGAIYWRYSSGLPGIRTIGSASSSPVTTLSSSSYGGTLRPNIRITFTTPSNLTSDAGVSEIVYPTGGVIANTSFNVTAKIINFGTDTLTTADVKWTLDGVSQPTFAWTGSLPQNDLSSVITLGSVNLPLGVHEIKIWTDNPNGVADMNYGNDTMKISFMACASLLSGTYTIGGTNPDFVDFQAAIIALDQCGINAPVVFNVAPGTYTGQLILPWISGTSSVNTVTFQAANNDSTSVTIAYTAPGAAANFLLKLDSARYVTFKNIGFAPGSTAFATAVVLDKGATNNTFKGNLFVGKTGTTNDFILIRSEHPQNTNNLIMGNRFEDGSMAMYIKGTNASNTLDGFEIRNNVIEGFSSTGIRADFVKALVIDNNTIISHVTNAGQKQGIHINNGIDTMKITRNRIALSNATNTNGIHLEACTAAVGLEGLVANNFISILNGSNLTYGMRIINTARQKIYYNSLYIQGSHNTDTRGINTVSTSSNIQVLNNNIETNKYPTFYEGASCSRSNYNNLYSTGNLYGFFTTSLQSFSTLNAYKTASQKDTNSVSYIPYFASTTDLHTANGLLNAAATPVPEVTIDIDGEVRDLLMPDIGADEFVPSPIDAAVLTLAAPLGGCGKTSTEQVTVVIKNVGTSTISTGLSGHFRFNNSATVVSESITASIIPGDTLFYTFAATVNMDVTSFGVDSVFALQVWTTLTGDNVPQNDSVLVHPESFYTPPAPTASNVNILYGQTATLTALSNDSLFWFTSDTATVEVYMGNPFITPTLYDTTHYWVSAGVFAGGEANIGTGTIQNGNTSYPAVYGNWYWGAKHQMLIPASELIALGMKKGNIKSLAFDVVTPNACPALTNFEIKVGTTSISAVTTAWEAGLTQVFLSPSYQPVAGWNNHTFTTPFYWDGVSNLIIETCFNNSSYISSGNATLKQSATSYASTHMVYNDNSTVCSNPSMGSTVSQRPNMKLGIEGTGCLSAKVPLTVFVGGFPTEDAGIVTILNPVISTPSGTPTPITVELKNYGLNNMLSVGIVWKLNNVIQDTVQWTGSLAINQSVPVTIDTMIFNGGNYCISAYTILPNNIQDNINTNDTANHCFSACMGGIYTIGPATAGTYDFNTFNQALSTLVSAGICGSIIFDVQPGTYTEQLTIPEIPGMDSSQTVTFRGASVDSSLVILQYTAAGSADYWTVRFNGADWFRFEKMTIKGLGASYARTVEFRLGAHNNIISNCEITVPTGTSSLFVPIYNTSSNNNYNTFRNNRIVNGYYGAYWFGAGTTSLQKSTVFESNVFEGFFYYGVYLYYQDSLIFTKNTVRSLTGFANGYGVYGGYCQNFSQITKNKIDLNPTGTVYGGLYMYFCTSTTTSRGLVANNFITIGGTNTTSTQYALRMYYGYSYDVYYNSINLTAGGLNSRALDVYYGGDVRVLNNYARATAGGYAYYVTPVTAVSQSDHNNYYTNGTNLAYWSVNQPSLAALKTASTMDQNSHNINVPYIASNDLHILSTYLSAKGLATTRVTDDIDGELRSAFPTIGADEVPLIAIDAGVTTILTPPILTNEAQQYPVQVVFMNYGTDTIFTMNVQYTVNGGTPVIATYNGMIPSLGTDTLTMPAMTSPAGSSVICAKTLLTGDVNFFNDEYCKNFFGTPTADVTAVKIIGLEDGCDIGLDTISVMIHNLGVTTVNSPSPQVFTASYRINGVSTIVTENVTAVIPPNDSVVFHFATLANLSAGAVDTIFNVVVWLNLQGDNVLYNDTAKYTVKSLHIPASPLAPAVTTPYGTTALLTVASNDTILWFTTPIGGNFFHMGSTYTTGVLYSDTTIYVEAVGALPLQTFTLGTGTLVNTNTNYPTPYGNWYWGNKEQYLILQSELTALGMVAGEFSELAFDVVAPQGVGLQGFTIKMGHTSATSMTNTFQTIPMTSVYTHPAYVDVAGWNVHAFQTPFQWNGTSNLVVEVCFNNSSYTYNGTVRQTATPFTSVTRYNSDAANVCSQASGSTAMQRPNMRFVAGANGCSSARVPLQVFVSGQMACDVGVSSILEPVTAVNLGSQENVKVRVTNFGTAAQSNIPVSFKIDNLPVVTETITASIPANGHLDYTFVAKANLSIGGNTYQLKAWTGLSCDSTPQNDTLWKSVTHLLPNYCNSTATSALYSEITNVTLGTMNHTSAATGAMYTNHSAIATPPMLSPGVSYPMSITSSFAPGTSTTYTCWTKAWVDFNRDGVFDPATEEIFNAGTTNNNTVTANIQVPLTAMTGNTVMRVVLTQTSSMTSVTPCNTYTYGETEDYMIMIAPQAPCDAGVTQVITPTSLTQSGVALPVWIRFMNFGSNPIAAGSLSIAYTLNSGTPVVVAYPSGLAVGASDSIQMPSITLPIGNNTFCAYTILACDSNTFNDEICKGIYGQYQTTLPYFDDFETSNMWYKPTASPNWQYGTPSANIINAAYSGSKSWVTNLTGDYTNNTDEFLYTPLFSFTGLTGNDTITLSFYHWCAMATSDYGRVQYSTNGGQSWSTLGFNLDNQGTNWYNISSGGLHYFSHSNSGWMYSAYKLSPNTFNGQQQVQFRFHFWSNASTVSNGWAIDNFRLSLPMVPNDIGVTAITAPMGDTAAGVNINATVTITNFGLNAQNMFPVQLKVNGNVVATETWTGTLPSLGTTSYTFIQSFQAPNAAYALCARTTLTGDAFPMNDEFCKNYGALPAYHDVGVTQILAPIPDSINQICFYDTITHLWYKKDVIVRIQNFGQNAQTSIPISYSFFNGGPVYTDTWTGSLQPGATVDVTLQNQFPPRLGAQQVCVETALAGDPITTNNKACKSYVGVTCIGIDEADSDKLILLQNMPNPAGNSTIIGYNVPQAGKVTFGLVNMVGQVLNVERHEVVAGYHEIELDVNSLAAGVYYYFIEFNGHRLTKKMVVNR